MKVVFIAGAYYGDGTDHVIQGNILRARLIAEYLAEQNIGFICPHTHTAGFHESTKAGEQFYRELYLRLLESCDAVYAMEGWEQSKGACAEIEKAHQLKKPVFLRIGDVILWQHDTGGNDGDGESTGG